MPTNRARLVLTRVAGAVVQASANEVITSGGIRQVRPGQGGVTLGVVLGTRAGGWESDHLEIGASIRHPDAAAERALQVLSCVGNTAHVTSGPATGAEGVVVGKHGALLVAFADTVLSKLGPGDWITVNTLGCGLQVEGEPDLAVHSCAPDLLDRLLEWRAGRIAVTVAALLPAEAAAAGIGMPVSRFNVDLDVSAPPLDMLGRDLRFGDLVALEDHDHRHGRQVRAGWVAIGVIAHGRSMAGGHGLGFVTLVTGPRDRFIIEPSPTANLAQLLAPRSRS